MKLPTLAGAAAAALLTVALGAPMANAADTRTASPATPATASDCWWSHHYDGYWHHTAKMLCDHDYYYDSHGYYDGDNFGRNHNHFSDRDRGTDRGTFNRGTNDAATGRSTNDAATGRSAAERGTTDTTNTDRGAANNTDRGTGNTPNGSAGSNTGSNNTGNNAGGTFRR